MTFVDWVLCKIFKVFLLQLFEKLKAILFQIELHPQLIQFRVQRGNLIINAPLHLLEIWKCFFRRLFVMKIYPGLLLGTNYVLMTEDFTFLCTWILIDWRYVCHHHFLQICYLMSFAILYCVKFAQNWHFLFVLPLIYLHLLLFCLMTSFKLLFK